MGEHAKKLPDMSFINQDIERQRQLATQALDNAKKIDQILATNPPPTPDMKTLLESQKQQWVDMARGLANNAAFTITSGTASFSTFVAASNKSP